MPFGGNYPSILTLSGWSNVSKNYCSKYTCRLYTLNYTTNKGSTRSQN